VADIRIPAHPLPLIGLPVTVAILAIAVAAALGGGGGTARSVGAQPRTVSAAQAAATYGYPSRCTSIASKPRHSRISLAEFDRRVWCERYRATPNSSIYQFVGAP